MEWLAEPLERLYVQPQGVGDGNGQWGRIEQRAQSMLLASLPTSLKGQILANRATSSVQVLFRIFTRYQPGGLGERAMLLRQLVDPRTPTSMLEALEQLRAWKRYLRRAQKLKIATPDATLLVGALEKYVGVIVKASPQTSFRLNSARAGLRIDVAPVVDSVLQFADVVLAEAEAGFHSTAQGTAAKVKDFGKGGGKGKDGGGKDAATAPTCRFFLTDSGCKKGAGCTYRHEFDRDKRGRCWNCGGTSHTRKHCPVKTRRSRDGNGGAAKTYDGTDAKGQIVKKVEMETAVSTTGGGGSPSRRVNGPLPDGGSGEAVRGLIQEAAGLLKSLRGPELRKIQLSSLEVKNKSVQDAILAAGATATDAGRRGAFWPEEHASGLARQGGWLYGPLDADVLALHGHG